MNRAQLTVFTRIAHALASIGYIVAIWIVAGFTALVLSTDAYGQDQPCGKGGTAKIADGTVVTRTDQEAIDQNAQIRADGYWWTCPAPVYVPPPKLPADCVPQSQGFRTWTVDGNTCTTARRNAPSLNDPARDRVIRHGRFDVWSQWTGSMRGSLIERCTDGVRTVAGSSCEPVTHCDTQWSDGVYTYDARPVGKRVPVGMIVEATSQAGKVVRLKCIAGDFQRVR
jgi:hypothetical protein